MYSSPRSIRSRISPIRISYPGEEQVHPGERRNDHVEIGLGRVQPDLMGSQPAAVVVRVADAGDVPALCLLRSLWSASAQDRSFEQRMASWLASEGDRRTTWLAELADSPVGMGSLFEYRRMPRPGRGDSCWGYVANVFVREELRNRGIGSALLAAITSAADGRGYARLVLSPNPHALPFFYRAGFTDPAHTAGDHLLVRPRPAR